jgi:hypothetical protein
MTLALLVPALVRADYIELKRSALLKAEPRSDSDTLARLNPPTKLILIQEEQENGYYHVRSQDTGEEGWVYRTMGRRYQGGPGDVGAKPASTQPGGSGTPFGTTPPPTEDSFATATDHVWGQPRKDHGCGSVNGLPDPECTPGDILKDETTEMICSSEFHTKFVRGSKTTQSEKNKVYGMYGIPHPANNTGSTQVCEIDHLVSLELGGADTIPNLWPECSPGYAGWQGPGFRDKDGFENYLWFHVCVNQDLSLQDAQIQIATNWRKYWELAGKPECRNRIKCE